MHERLKTLFLRLACVVYDTLILVALWIFAAAVWIFIAVALGRYTPGQPLIPGNIPFDLYILAVSFLYLGGLWRRTGQTLGMRAWRMKLVSDDGDSITWQQGLKRMLAAILSWLLLGAGFLWILLDRDARALHDRLSHTHMIRLARPED